MRTDMWNELEPVHVDPARKSWKDVLRNLIYHANMEGCAWPGVKTIRAETGYKSDKAVTDALAGLRAAGIISHMAESGTSGGRGRPTKWLINNLSNVVHKLTTGKGEPERDTVQKGEATSTSESEPNRASPKKGEATSKKGEVTSKKGEVTSARNNKEYKQEVSRSVSIRARGENHEVTSPFVDNSGKDASAEGRPAPHKAMAKQSRKEGPREPRAVEVQDLFPQAKPDYVAMCAKLGWKPNDPEQTPPEDADLARRSIVSCAYRVGLSPAQAKEFLRYNTVRRWKAIDQASCVKDLAKAFLDRWKDDDIEAYWAEVNRRREAEKRRAASRKGRS